jgi:tetratricopeptide (TPR) repeat protein
MKRALVWLFYHAATAGMLFAPPANLPWSGQASTEAWHEPELDAGFRLLYEMKPEEARTHFAAWDKSHSEDPLGSAAEAASYLFEECYRQGILTSEYFTDEKRFLGKNALKPDQALSARFFSSVQRAQALAQARLKIAPDDANALFAMTLSVGMQADYTSLIDKYQLESLRMITQANEYAKKLLAIAPDAADAYFILGAVNYIIGSLPWHQRFLLGLKRIHGDKRGGIRQLEIAAARGHYLRPFSKIFLALAALREKKIPLARTQLAELVSEFPQNPLFALELAKLSGRVSAAIASPLHLQSPSDNATLFASVLVTPMQHQPFYNNPRRVRT